MLSWPFSAFRGVRESGRRERPPLARRALKVLVLAAVTGRPGPRVVVRAVACRRAFRARFACRPRLSPRFAFPPPRSSPARGVRGLCSCQGPRVVCRAGAGRLWRRGCHPFLSRRRLCVAVRRVVVAALARRCLSVSWRPCRRACGGLPSGLCRWPYLACAWRLAPPGCLWRPCRRGPGVRGVPASRPSVSLRYHFFRRLSNVKSTNDFVTFLCVYDKSQNIKMVVLLLFRALRRAHIVEARFRRVRVARCVPAFPVRRCSSLSEWQALDAAAAAGIGSAGSGWPLACSGWPLALLLAAGVLCWRLALLLAAGVLCWLLAVLLAAGGSAGGWLLWRRLAALLAAGGSGWPLACSAGCWRFCWLLAALLAAGWLLAVLLAAGGSGWRLALLLAAGGSGWRLALLLAAGGSGWRFCWRLARRAADPPGFPCRRACRFLAFCGFPTTFALQNRALFVQKGGAGRIAGPTSKGPRPPHARNAEGFEWGVS